MARNTSGSFTRTIHRIAVISVTISLAALIISFFVLYGFKDAIRQKVYNLSGHLTVDKYAISNSFEENSILVTDSLMNELRRYPKVTHAQRYIIKAALIKSEEGVQGILLKGVGIDFDRNRFNSQMVKGTFPAFGAEHISNEVVISARLATLLRLDVDDVLMLFFVQQPPRFRRIEVAGIYSTGMEEFDDKFIFGDIGLLQRINDWPSNQVGGIDVFISDEDDMDEMESSLFNTLPVDLNVTSAERRYPQIFEWLLLLNRNVLILLVIIVLVAALGMISMVLILIMERTRMIGLLKALGASNQLLRQIFIYTGLRLVFRGLLFGNSIALIFCWLQYKFRLIPLDVSNYYMHFVPISFHWPTLIVLNVLMIVLIGLTLFIPVRIISGVQPVQAIRFD